MTRPNAVPMRPDPMSEERGRAARRQPDEPPRAVSADAAPSSGSKGPLAAESQKTPPPLPRRRRASSAGEASTAETMKASTHEVAKPEVVERDRALLVILHKEHDPDRLGDIPVLLTKYGASEEQLHELYHALLSKYEQSQCHPTRIHPTRIHLTRKHRFNPRPRKYQHRKKRADAWTDKARSARTFSEKSSNILVDW